MALALNIWGTLNDFWSAYFMEDQSTSSQAGWQPRHAYFLAAICLILGLTLGYLVRGSASSPAPVAAMPADNTGGAPRAMPSLDQMKHMAEKKAEPLLAKLQQNPKDIPTLIQVGDIYRSTHQFKDAADYYGKALELDPKNVTIRTEMASCLYYSGDIDGALGQLQQSLVTDPANANSLFNIGMIKWREKKDSKGALSAWEQLLKSNPKLAADKKSQVEKLIAQVKQQGVIKN